MKKDIFFSVLTLAVFVLSGCTSTPQNQSTKTGAMPEIKQNLIESYNCTFEGSDSNGNIYWWNDASWSQGKLKQVPYLEGESPDVSCGNFYAKAISENDESAQIQICHADIASIISSGTKYVYTYWAKAESEGTLKLNVNGATSDWSSVSSTQGFPESDLTTEWKKYTGSFVLEDSKDQVQFQFAGSNGMTYYLDDFKIEEDGTQEKTIEKDIKSLKDVVATSKGLGKNAIIGTEVNTSEYTDELYMDLLYKHFNGVTLGNELKLDCMMGYHDGNKTNPGLTKTVLNGKEIVVPILDHSRADAILDKILELNAQNRKQIKVRGHVLVWHSQAPEWFFHEDYVASNPYVSKDEMNERLEWYIKEMMDYYTNPKTETGKKYSKLFYGWDVVNEAISDNTGSYRTDTEPGNDSLTDPTHGTKSSWWKVYQSNEYIINAFKFANKYAPKSLELYYNDYNECNPQKRDGIVELLKAVKNAEGTRIDGMGMQGHYDMLSPTVGQLEDAIRSYCGVVGKVMLTEVDIKGVKDDTKCAYRYKEIYEKLVELDKEDGIEINGLIFWGSVDKYSWLQSSSNVGGGSDGSEKQRPLLFNDNYKAKPAYYAFVDPSKLAPYTQKIVIIQSESEEFDNAESYSFEKDGVSATIRTIWQNNKIKAKVEVNSKNKFDSIDFCVNDKIVNVSVDQMEKTGNVCGAVVVLEDSDLICGQNKILDLKINTSKGTVCMSDVFIAEGIVKPFTEIKKGSVKIDGQLDAEWAKAKDVPLQINIGANVRANAKLLWDEEKLFVYMTVKDSVLNEENEEFYQQDSIEVFIDENNSKFESYDEDDKQYRISYKNVPSFNGSKCNQENMKSFAKITNDGYIVEASFKWTDVKPQVGSIIGLDLQINDADTSGSRKGTLNWFDETGTGYTNPKNLGTVLLTE